MRIKFLAALACAFLIGIAGISMAQDAGVTAQENEPEYSYGTVVSVNGDAKELVVSEYDWSNDTETNVTFSIDPNVVVENSATWKEIPAGAEVDIEYALENGKKVAKSISVYTMEESEEAGTGAEAEAMPEEVPPEEVNE